MIIYILHSVFFISIVSNSVHLHRKYSNLIGMSNVNLTRKWFPVAIEEIFDLKVELPHLASEEVLQW